MAAPPAPGRRGPPRPPPGKPAPASAPPRPDSQVEDGLELTELVEVPCMQVAVHDGAAHLAAATDAIVAAGHALALSATGPGEVAAVRAAVTSGQIDVVIVGLPGGESIIEAAHALAPRSPVVIAACGGHARDAVARAHAAGADLVTLRPYTVSQLAPVLLAAARVVEQRRDLMAARGNEAVLRARLESITDSDGQGLQPFELFQKVLELELKRARRYRYALSVALFAVESSPPAPPPGVRGILRARAGNALIHTIRDIDIATELDKERYLVLLPYTDLTGATELARRVIRAVAAGDPVVASGRSFAPRVVGAVAGAKPGQQLSFSRLMRDASRALEQARRDGAELAVQP